MINPLFQSSRSFAAKRGLIIFTLGVLGFLLPLIDAMMTYFPVPRCGDEFGYLLQSYTFMNVQLSNQTHPMWEHFQSYFITHQPAYQAKYPPGQGLFLTLGSLLFGHPAFGVWISSGLMMSALTWALYQWLRPRWACAIGILLLLQLCVRTLWVESYFGGCVAAIGGALIIGSMISVTQVHSKKRALQLALLSLGVVILANTRPFEGMIVSVFCLLWLLWSLSRQKLWLSTMKHAWAGLIILVLGAVWIGMYNHATTGHVFLHPVQHYTNLYNFNTYFEAAMGESSRTIPEHYYNKISLELQAAREASLTGNHAAHLIAFIRQLFHFLLFPGLFICLLAMPFILFVKKYRWLFALLLTTCLLSYFMYRSKNINLTHMHYYAPLLASFAILFGAGLQRLYCFKFFTLTSRRSLLFVLVLVGILAQLGLLLTQEKQPPHYVSTVRSEIENHVLKNEEKVLVVVKYAPTVHQNFDVVYNTHAIDKQQLVWAHDLGPEKNSGLAAYYLDRHVWGVEISLEQGVPVKYHYLRGPIGE